MLTDSSSSTYLQKCDNMFFETQCSVKHADVAWQRRGVASGAVCCVRLFVRLSATQLKEKAFMASLIINKILIIF